MPRKPRIHYTETDKVLMWGLNVAVLAFGLAVLAFAVAFSCCGFFRLTGVCACCSALIPLRGGSYILPNPFKYKIL